MPVIGMAMEPEPGKLFIGGISWETDEDRLQEYFGQFGDLVEVMIMRDWNTRRSRGFGFIVFADPAHAEGLTLQKHMIDGRMVEVKKAIPRVNKNNGTGVGSPNPNRTKKIFVGGLASDTTEGDFRSYFEQFGVITDVVVMHDLNTRKPRGFGFVTYDSEDAVDAVLHETFHKLNGKMVEVKRAVPKEQLPGSSTRGYNHDLHRFNGLPNGFGREYSPNPFDARFGMLSGPQDGYSLFSNSFGMGMNLESSLHPSLLVNSNLNKSLNYGRQSAGSYGFGNSNRYNAPVGDSDYAGSLLSLLAQNLSLGGIANENGNLGDSFSSSNVSGNNLMRRRESLESRQQEESFGLWSGNHGWSSHADAIGSSFPALRNEYEYDGNHTGAYEYDANSMYGDTTSKFSSSGMEVPTAIGYGLSKSTSDVKSHISASYIGNFTSNDNWNS